MSIENYLNSFSSITIYFAQIDESNAPYKKGYIAISKPSKMRIEYELEDLFIMKNGLLLHRNKDLNSDNYLPANQILLGFLTDNKFSFATKTKVLNCNATHSTLTIAFKMLEDDSKVITLSLSSTPLQLTNVSIEDDNDIIMIDIEKIIKNPQYPKKYFDFNH